MKPVLLPPKYSTPLCISSRTILFCFEMVVSFKQQASYWCCLFPASVHSVLAYRISTFRSLLLWNRAWSALHSRDQDLWTEALKSECGGILKLIRVRNWTIIFAQCARPMVRPDLTKNRPKGSLSWYLVLYVTRKYACQFPCRSPDAFWKLACPFMLISALGNRTRVICTGFLVSLFF